MYRFSGLLVGRITGSTLAIGIGMCGFVLVAHAEGLGSQITSKVHSVLSELLVVEQSVLRSPPVPESAPGELLVKFKGEQTFERRSIVPFASLADALGSYRNRSDVLYAEPNYIAYAFEAPNDPYYSYQWNFDNAVNRGIHMNDVWGQDNGSGVVIAVVDTGVAYENYGSYTRASDLAQTKFASGYDFVDNDNHPNDDNGHGTHITGTIAESTGNGTGVAGIASGAMVMPVKVLNSRGSGSYADVANGIRWAADHGAKVINLSLGGSSGSQTLLDAVAYAHAHGALVVAAAGNDGQSTISYPAAYSQHVMSVGATRFDQTRAPYSNYGTGLSLVAPGGDTRVDQNGDGYGDGILQQTFSRRTGAWGYYFYQGTSMATPHVVGVAALVIGAGIATTPDEVRSVLENTADDLGASGYDTVYGHGLVNAAQAIAGSLTIDPPPPTDLCPNVSGDQTSTPCADQECVDQGGTWNGSSCDLPPPPPEEPVVSSMHVANITLNVETRRRNRFCRAEATVAIVDANVAAVSGATVSGNWSGATSESASNSTNGSGEVTFQTRRWERCGTFTFTVNSVSKDGWEYTPGDNTETSDSITP